ncbi:MAG: FGGY family carbohydrate kinase, partial [Bacilli bacterium]
MTNNSSLVLTIDVGTQSVRCAVVDQTGQVLALERKQYQPTYVSPQPGFAEHNPNYYFDCLVEVCQKMKSNHTDLLSKVVAMGLTTFRDSPVFLDKNFLPVRPMVLWLDQRQAEI